MFVSREAVILAQNTLESVWRLRPDPLGSPQRCPRFRGGRDSRGKRQGKGRARGYVKGRREDVREEKGGEGRKKAKESRVVPHPKLNPGYATDKPFGFCVVLFVCMSMSGGTCMAP